LGSIQKRILPLLVTFKSFRQRSVTKNLTSFKLWDTYSLEEGTFSGVTSDPVPKKIRPITEQAEREIIYAIMGEIADEYAVDIQLAPVLDRCSGDLVFAESDPDQQKIIVIGALHATRLVGGLAEGGLPVINLAKPGWILDSVSAAEIAAKVKKK
jgi:hypothetical protein